MRNDRPVRDEGRYLRSIRQLVADKNQIRISGRIFAAAVLVGVWRVAPASAQTSADRTVSGLGKRLMTTIYISSAIISVLPRYRDEVLRTLTTLHNVEVRHANASKIIIIIESVASGILGARLAKIASRQGVLSAKHGVRAPWEARRDRRSKTYHSRDANY
ncbi:chaperone NapD [Nitrobacter sp.]|uniref:chaperone NapD n=1 Tax=Nitrobacter sp. TaxID=29420 RepID=UPI0029CAC33A|nr:chaperone NapD [Nitrobacter sp.]